MLLPGLLVDANLKSVLELTSNIEKTRDETIELDASKVHAIEPVALCLLAIAANNKRTQNGRIAIKGLPTRWHSIFRALCPGVELRSMARSPRDAAVPRTDGAIAHSSREANSAANALASRISQFVPQEDRESLLTDYYGLRIYNAIQPALAHILVELADNVFNHARTEAYRNAAAWMVVQYYGRGDLVRVAVVDDGCGILGSMRGMPDNPPHSHYEAIELAFRPFVSSKNLPMIYADRRHMGIGLPVCRDLCRRMDGHIYAVSGDSWVFGPGLETEKRHRADPFYQGTIISMEFHRRAATVGTLREILRAYSGTVDLPLRFHND